MSSKPAFKRRQYLVEPAYQLRFVMRLLTLLVIVMLSSFAAASALLWAQFSSPDLTTDSCLAEILYGIAFSHAISLLIMIPISYLFGIRQTHRVVGPLKRIKAALSAIGEGDFTQRIILRKSDVLTDLAGDINKMAERLQKRSSGS